MGRHPNIYYAAAWKNPVAQGVSDTWYVELRGYAKVASPAVPYCVANEYVCGRIGALLGLPVPPGAVIQPQTVTQGAAWVTLNFSPKNEPLPPVDPATVAAALPDLAAGIVVFDLFVANTDRHAGNLAFLPSQKRLDVFDHSHALMGVQQGRVQQRLDQLRSMTALSGEAVDGVPSNRHCLIDHVADAPALLGWAEELEQVVSDRFLGRTCQEVAALGIGATPEEMMRVEEFLRDRRPNVKRLLYDHRDEFAAIPADAWGLEL
ncbi:MAG: HipA family kinase [Gaiellaceae bacterium]